MKPTKASYFSSSLDRGLQILASFGTGDPWLGIADIAGTLSLNRSTVHRYVVTLEALGYLHQNTTTKKYRLGPRVMDLGLSAISSMGLRDVARPYLEELSFTTGRTVSMAILDGADIVYVERVQSHLGIDLNLHVGSRLPAYCTSMGKVLLASLPEAESSALLDLIQLLPRGPNTITQRAALARELQSVRSSGVAVNNQELSFGLVSIAAPVRDHTGEVVAAINIGVDASTHSAEVVSAKLAPLLISTGAKVSAHLGHRFGVRRDSG